MHPTGVGGTHPRLFQWVRDYFSGRVQRPRSSSSGKQTPSNPPPSADQGPSPGDSGSTAAAVSSPDHSSPPGTGAAVSSSDRSPPKMTAAEIHPPDHSLPPRIETTAATKECPSPEDIDYPPIYFQHEGKCHCSMHTMLSSLSLPPPSPPSLCG